MIIVAVEIFVRKRRSLSERRDLCQEDRKSEGTAFVSFDFKRKSVFSKASLRVVTFERRSKRKSPMFSGPTFFITERFFF